MTTKKSPNWEPFNYGLAEITFYNGDGELFNGELDKLAYGAKGIRNKITGEVVIISSIGKIIGEGHANI